MSKLFPQQTANQNVPDNVFLVYQSNSMSGEITTTYYMDLEGNCWQVTDWKGHHAFVIHRFEMCRLVGLGWRMIEGMYYSWYENMQGKRHDLDPLKGKESICPIL